ncbi:ABC transporter permease [Enhydrobacter sp.]|jgi:NitT/TauT family transport system permease protein|uniref:ABC transporter permease n=1 Tax=Enhydrobacter sp. TaxID=1894999 RepID=UPI00260DFE24|nr:ABC transporter permease [Enhydrobacter sp.]WIM10070.1 MAG: Hydroxymethylpyrimidine ABC transporter, transmembrane component [Enhydrobacter sp.]
MSVQAAPPLEKRRRPPAAAFSEIVVPLLATAAFFVMWEGICRTFNVPAYLVPAPSQIWTDTVAIGPAVLGHTMATLKTVLLGFAVSIVISLPLAVLLTASPAIAGAIYPFLVWTQSIPKVALAPILVVALGSNELPRVVITVLVAFFPLVISVATGLMSVPPELLELSRACRASKWSELWRIRLPFAIPFIFAGLKVAVSLAVVGAVVAEFVNADSGLGFLIVTSTAFFKVPVAFGALIILSIMGVVLFQIVVIIERVFFPWSSANAQVAS